MKPNPTTVKELWSALPDHLAKTKDELNGLTDKKLVERGKLLEDESTPERLVFEVERHNAIAGAQYRKGTPMTSFETRMVKYNFEPQSGSVFEVSSRVIDMKIDPLSEVVEWELDFSVRVEFDETTGDYSVTDSDNTIRFTAPTLQEAEGRLRQKIRDLVWGIELGTVIDEGPELDAMVEEIRTEACEIAVEKLRDAWAECENPEE